ncbi:hypothetical protein BC939DRAFT_531202 [Gamsiella multidivaricata]|uniref:uncharacterized protein n=1 Tax=Gamsiella multidivaricata TaxID=101098 RepID=UPI0022211E02|nr:uncharacterized protein BC939DRAFT_531202 [Gamsiella multidivaricata]KAI7819498.1 hypothetical protein BC939DRAFT_531202 [Gamsiella multidivaricata]
MSSSSNAQQLHRQSDAQLEEGHGSSPELATEACSYSSSDGLSSLPQTPLQRIFELISKTDAAAILFCNGTKSVVMGILLIKILYANNPSSSLAGLLATPLLIYHVEQPFSGAFMVGWLKQWVETKGQNAPPKGQDQHDQHSIVSLSEKDNDTATSKGMVSAIHQY